jgi:hypothetical protein
LDRDARQLGLILEDLADLVQSGKFEERREAELLERGEGCQAVLLELEVQLRKWNNMGSKSRRAWDRLTWDSQVANELRDRLISNVTMLSAFYQKLMLSSHIEIHKALDTLLQDYQGGHRDPSSVSSLGGADTLNGDDDAAWPQLIRDLEDVGISQEVAQEHRDLIIEWFIKAINEGKLQEKAPSAQPSPPPSPPSRPPTPPPRPPNINQPVAQDASPQILNPQQGQETPMFDHSEPFAPPTPAVPPPDYPTGNGTDMLWTAQLVVHHWNNREWDKAEEQLILQIEATQAGGCVEIKGVRRQPDCRILNHLLGVISSFKGNFVQAKSLFESIIRGPHVSSGQIDTGDIAAAHWLGDTCIFLREPANAALAYAIALEGLIRSPPGNRGTELRISRLKRDLGILNRYLSGLTKLERAFRFGNADASTILPTIPTENKLWLIDRAVENAKCYENDMPHTRGPPTDITMVDGFLTHPLVDPNSWPLPHDPFLHLLHAVLATRLVTVNEMVDESAIPVTGLGQSKKLAFVTSKDLGWLIKTLRQALTAHHMEYRERRASFVCLLSHYHHSFTYLDAVEIKVRKLPLRSLCGFKVASSGLETRVPRGGEELVEKQREDVVTTISDILREFCVYADMGGGELR